MVLKKSLTENELALCVSEGTSGFTVQVIIKTEKVSDFR